MFTFFPLRKLEEYWLLTNNDNSKRNDGEQGGDDTALNGAHLAGELNLQLKNFINTIFFKSGLKVL
jgi:hypothetical protein